MHPAAPTQTATQPKSTDFAIQPRPTGEEKTLAGYRVAILGATGAVGTELLQLLEERQFPIAELKLLASARSAGQTCTFGGQTLTVEPTTAESFQGVDIVLASAGGQHLEGVGRDDRGGRRSDDRQLQRLPDAARCAPGGSRSEPGGGREP